MFQSTLKSNLNCENAIGYCGKSQNNREMKQIFFMIEKNNCVQLKTLQGGILIKEISPLK